MSIFSFKRNDPVSQMEQRKNYFKKQLNSFYSSLLSQNKIDFYRTDFMDYIKSTSIADQQLVSDLLLNDMENNRIYASFQELCPNPQCHRLFLEGAVLPYKDAGGKFSLLFMVGQVALFDLNLICPYCQTKIPKEKSINLASQLIIYHITPEFEKWYINNASD